MQIFKDEIQAINVKLVEIAKKYVSDDWNGRIVDVYDKNQGFNN